MVLHVSRTLPEIRLSTGLRAGLSTLVLASLAACGGGGSAPAPAPVTSDGGTAPPPPPAETVAISLVSDPIADGAENVPLGQILQIEFDTAIDETTLNQDTVQLQIPGSDTSLPLTLSLSEDGRILDLDTSGDLHPLLDYRLVLDGLEGTQGEILEDPVIRDFQTGSTAWPAGAYALMVVDQPIEADNTIFSSSSSQYVQGIALRYSWGEFEDDEGNYDFATLDNALRVIAAEGKLASLAILPASRDRAWPAMSAPADIFYANNRNPNQDAAGDCSLRAVPFDANYQARFRQMLEAMGDYLRADPVLNDTVAYIVGAGDFSTYNWAYGISFTEVYLDDQCTQETSWSELGFSADTLIEALQVSVTDFMAAFPDKPHWFSVGDTRLDQDLSCGDTFCIAFEVSEWGTERYPDRFGVWREDLSANRNAPNAGTLWYEISRFRPRLGAQMVFSTVNCPGDDEKTCRVADNGTPANIALRTAIDVGSSADPLQGYGYYLMPYQEVYAADITNPDLDDVLADAFQLPVWRSDTTAPDIPENLAGTANTDRVELSWSPASDRWDNENSYTLGLSPAADGASTTSIVYRIRRDGVVTGTSDQAFFAETGLSAGRYRYTVSAVDAVGNESPDSAEITVDIE